jgi:hypothetical protein
MKSSEEISRALIVKYEYWLLKIIKRKSEQRRHREQDVHYPANMCIRMDLSKQTRRDADYKTVQSYFVIQFFYHKILHSALCMHF